LLKDSVAIEVVVEVDDHEELIVIYYHRTNILLQRMFASNDFIISCTISFDFAVA